MMRCTLATDDDARMSCFDVLAELRPHLVRERFLDDVRRLAREGYQLAMCLDGDVVVSVAGFRPMETFSTGPIVYVDDLVTTASARSRGCGNALLAFLLDHARALGRARLELDSGLQRLDAHRFYRANGMADVALKFARAT